MKPIKIEIYNNDGLQYYSINNFTQNIFSNKRLYTSLKRLNADFSDLTEIKIPVRSENKISLLEEIQLLLIKFDFTIETSEEIKSELANFDRENSLFQEFTKKPTQ